MAMKNTPVSHSNLDVSFKCLAIMLNLNHKLVEPVLVQLWFIVLATEHGKWGKVRNFALSLHITYPLSRGYFNWSSN